MQLAMVGEKMVPFEELEPAYLDRGLYFGDGVYEVLRSYDGKIFAFDEHMERFKRSVAEIAIEGVDIDKICERVKKAFEAAGLPNAKIYFHVTRGSHPRNHSWGKDLKPNFLLTVTNLPDATKHKAEGIAVSTYPDLRWKRCDIKSLNLLPNVMATQDAVNKGCYEAILVDEKGFLTEGAGSAFFAIIKGKLQTTPLSGNILPSVTRKFVFEAAKKIGLGIIEESLATKEAPAADELFIAVTTKDIVPVVKFEDKIVGDGKPGKITIALMDEFKFFTK